MYLCFRLAFLEICKINPYRGNPKTSMERQILHKHVWTWWSIFECRSPWWLVLYAIYTAKLRAYRKNLRRVVVESQVAPSFCTGAPKHEKMRFSAEIDGFLCASCWTQAEYFCQFWKCLRGSPTTVNSGRFNGP